MSVTIKSGNSGNLMTVDAAGRALVQLPPDPETAGIVAAGVHVDDGTFTGTVLGRELDANDDYALRTTAETLLLHTDFSGTALNTNMWSSAVATHAVAVASGVVTLNSASSVAVGSAIIQTYAGVPLLYAATTFVQTRLRTFNAVQANCCVEWGLGFVTGSSAPTDGIMFRLSPTGTFLGVVNFNGTERTVTLGTGPGVSPAFAWQDGLTYDTYLAISGNRAEFWVGNQLLGSLDIEATTQEAIARAGTFPMFCREYQTAGTAAAMRLEVAEVQVVQSGFNIGRPAAETAAINSLNANNGADGYATQGTQSNVTNSLNVTSGTITNTAAPTGGYVGTTLGGEFQFAAPAGAATDYIIFGYQVPAMAVANGGRARTLMLTEIRIDAVNLGAAVGTTPTVMVWSLGYGATAISLATADGAAAKAPRRIALGIQSLIVGAAIGQLADTVAVNFQTPIPVHPGQFLHVICKIPVGTATASQIIRGTVMCNGYLV